MLLNGNKACLTRKVTINPSRIFHFKQIYIIMVIITMLLLQVDITMLLNGKKACV